MADSYRRMLTVVGWLASRPKPASQKYAMARKLAVVDPTQPNPVLCQDLDLDNVEEFKRLDCRRYENCLTIAANKNFAQFTCNECKAYVKEAPRGPVTVNSELATFAAAISLLTDHDSDIDI